MYNFKEVEKKWQKYWEENETFKAITGDKKEKYYVLVEFPYPSGSGLHVGHVRSYTALDAVARMKRMAGFNVLFPKIPSIPETGMRLLSSNCCKNVT